MRWFLSMSIVLGMCGGLSWAQDELVEYDEYALEEEQIACDLGDSCCETCCMNDGCRFWGQIDYLLWWTKGSKLPPLIVTCVDETQRSGDNDVHDVLIDPESAVVYGDQYVNNDARSGFRVTGGFWLDCCHTIGIGADYFDLGTNSAHGEASGDGSPVLGRPFFNVETGQPYAEMISYPGVMSGNATVDSRDYFQSAGSWFRMNMVNCQCANDCCCSSACGDCGCGNWGFGIDMLAGYRYYRMDDSLTIRENLVDISDRGSNGTRFNITDDFRTKNRFHGGEIGFRTTVERGCWSLGLLTKMAIGSNRHTVTIDGSTTTNLVIDGTIFPPTTDANGILATQSNIGHYKDDQFTIIPQLGLELGYRIRDNIELFVGYNLIYWPHVQRAADQIDLNVDPRNWPPVQAGPLPFPAPKLCSTDYWAQGINFGVGCRY